MQIDLRYEGTTKFSSYTVGFDASYTFRAVVEMNYTLDTRGMAPTILSSSPMENRADLLQTK